MDNTPISEENQTVTKNASWGAIISIIIILAMVIIGAFYAWGERINQEHALEVQNSGT